MFMIRSAGGRLYNAAHFAMLDVHDGPEGSYIVGTYPVGPGEVIAVFVGTDHAQAARSALGHIWTAMFMHRGGCDLEAYKPDTPTPDTYKKCGIEPEPVEERVTGAQGTMESTAKGKPGPVGPGGRPWL